MSTLRELKEHIAKIGYSTIERDYVFSDIFEPQSTNRRASLAAFTQTPPSYRSAAIAVAEAGQNDSAAIAASYRALGAPLLFIISDDQVALWQIGASGVKRKVTTTSSQLNQLFFENAAEWEPRSIHRAKAIGQFDRSAQLDFVDVGLLPAIEGQVHSKLDSLLNVALAEAVGFRSGRARYQIDQRMLFRTVFRLLAAKVLQDREHKLAANWNPSDIQSVLKGISAYYTLEPLPDEQTDLQNAIFASAWDALRNGINFRNISVDDLAFVYENTLITQETRKDFGTHGTPRAVAEYAVGRMELWKSDPDVLRIYEPFCGAGIFLVAALRNLRERLPTEWSDAQRHKYLVQRIRGDEFDSFAKEVATLSLILADYPNANGWSVSQTDLFSENKLRTNIGDATVILCNPPFEDFTYAERKQYPQAAAHSVSKPITVLDAAIDAAPIALGFVLPEPFLKGPKYQEQRRRIDHLYKEIELVALPDRTFKHSVIRSSLVIAREKRIPGTTALGRLSSTVISARDRENFLRTGRTTETRTKSSHVPSDTGNLWVHELDDVWDYLANYPKLQSVADASRGVEWNQSQATAFSKTPKRGFSPGILAANSIRSLAILGTGFLDTRPSQLRGRAIDAAWQDGKLIANASRLSRGPWCFAAALDRSGLIPSQQLYGIWPKHGSWSLEGLAAVLNGPIAAAFLATQSPPDRIRLKSLLSVPVPERLPDELDELVKKYSRLAAHDDDLFSARRTERADLLLNQIDALVLRAYDLPPRLEKQLLEFFRGEKRPTRHEWHHWYPEGFSPFIPLYEFLSEEFALAKKPWTQKILVPLPDEEARGLSEYMD